jgi:hypothetical protein
MKNQLGITPKFEVIQNSLVTKFTAPCEFSPTSHLLFLIPIGVDAAIAGINFELVWV